jgi:hypothetical protein
VAVLARITADLTGPMLSDFTKQLRTFTGKRPVAGAALLVLAGVAWFVFAHIGGETPGHSEVSSQSRKGLQRYTPTPAEWATISPIAGTVVQRKIGPGQYVNAGASDPVLVIGDLLVKSGIIDA